VEVNLKQNIWDSEIRNTSASSTGEWSINEVLRAELVKLRSRSDETKTGKIIDGNHLKRRMASVANSEVQHVTSEYIFKATIKWQSRSIEFETKSDTDEVFFSTWTLEPGHKANLSLWTLPTPTTRSNLKLLEEPLKSYGWGDNENTELVFSGEV
jgi:hypothetical protein